MRRLEALMLALAVLALDAGVAAAQVPSVVTLDELWRMIERNPRIVASRHDADAARAERVTAGHRDGAPVERKLSSDLTLYSCSGRSSLTGIE